MAGTIDIMKETIQSADHIGLRARLVEAAGRLFVEHGYEHLSMRRVAQEVGCSQMAMYRHFANKEALTQHLCAQLYSQFTQKMHRQMDAADHPWERIRIFTSALIEFASDYPGHYSLIFLQRYSDPSVMAERERLGQEFLRSIRKIIREALPPKTASQEVDMRLRQIVSCLHGTAALLIAHPEAYGLTRRRAVRNVEDTVARLLQLD
jgi:AcrR family transcriptional regulator